MKYIKTFEKKQIKSKFKKGDYVVVFRGSNKKGVIYNVEYDSGFKCIIYDFEDNNNHFNLEENLRLMTPEEIEEYKMSKATNKFNI